MRSTLKAVPLVAALSVLAWSLQISVQAADGVLIVEKTTTGAKTETHQLQIEKNRMRAEAAGPNGQPMSMIFDGTKQVMWLVDTNRKTYSELTKADVDAMGGQMSAAMAQMEAAMRGMPPEQRAQMEAMMRGRGMPGMPGTPRGAAS